MTPLPTGPTRHWIAIPQIIALTIALASFAGFASAQALRDEIPITDGSIFATARVGNALVVGGSFTYIGPATGHGASLDANTGVASGLLKVDGQVFAVLSDGAGGWFLGGSFTSVLGTARTNFAHVLANHTLDALDPAPLGPVRALALSGSRLYIGGDFSSIAGDTRNKLAAIDLGSGNLAGWNPDMGADV